MTIFRSEIGSGFGEPGDTTPPRIPRSTPQDWTTCTAVKCTTESSNKLHNLFSSNSRATGKLYYFTLCTRSFRQGHRRKNQGAFHHLVLDTKLARESVSQTPFDAYYRGPHKKNTNDLHWCYSFLIHKQTGFVLISHQLFKK